MSNELPVAKNQKFFRELLAVSSGTWATLTGITNYLELSALEADIATFYLYNQDLPYETWIDVWAAYWRSVIALRVKGLAESQMATAEWRSAIASETKALIERDLAKSHDFGFRGWKN